MQVGTIISYLGTIVAIILGILGYISGNRAQKEVTQLEREKQQTQKTLAEQQALTNAHIGTLVETFVNQFVERSVNEGTNTDGKASNQLANLARGVREVRHEIRTAHQNIGALSERINTVQNGSNELQTVRDRLTNVQQRLARIEVLNPEELVHMLTTTHEIDRLATETKDNREASEHILTEIRDAQLRITAELGRYGVDIEQLRAQISTVNSDDLTRFVMRTLGQHLLEQSE